MSLPHKASRVEAPEIEAPGFAASEFARQSVVALALGRLNDALEPLEALIAGERVPLVASILAVDTARRCGRLDVVDRYQLAFDTVLADTEFHATHLTQTQVLRDRRAAVTLPPGVENLSTEDLRAYGRAAIECHDWRFGLEAWFEFLNRGSDAKEGTRRLAQCFAGLGNHGEALVYFAEALQLSPNEQIAQKLDRSKRFEQRKRDAFSKHAERLSEHAAIDAVRKALPGLATRDAALADAVERDLNDLSAMIGVSLLRDADGRAGDQPIIAETRPPIEPPAVSPDHTVSETASRRREPEAAPPAPLPSAGSSLGSPPGTGSSLGAIDKRRSRITSDQARRLALFSAAHLRDALPDVALPPPDAVLSGVLAEPFDTIVFTANDVATDAGALRTLEHASQVGRRALGVGIRSPNDPITYAATTLANGTRVLLLPNLTRPINLALRAHGRLSTDKAPLTELWLAATSHVLSALAADLQKQGDVVLATFDYAGLYVGGLVRTMCGVIWSHNVAEMLSHADRLDVNLRAAGRAWEEHFIRSADYVSAQNAATADALTAAYGVTVRLNG